MKTRICIMTMPDGEEFFYAEYKGGFFKPWEALGRGGHSAEAVSDTGLCWGTREFAQAHCLQHLELAKLQEVVKVKIRHERFPV